MSGKMTDHVETLADLAPLGNVVPEGYSYYEKLVTPGQDLSLPSAYFKWYDIRPADVPITADEVAESRACVASEAARLKLEGELGFVLLHRAGSSLLLLITTWRNTNELFESVYVRDASGGGGYRMIEFQSTHRATFCVWELAPIWHERHAWVRFLSSARDVAAKRAYIEDRFSGLV